MNNYNELVDIILEYMCNYDWYSFVDEYGNIENDLEAKIKAKEEILNTLINKPNDILIFLENNLFNMEENDELYQETNNLIQKIRKLVIEKTDM